MLRTSTRHTIICLVSNGHKYQPWFISGVKFIVPCTFIGESPDCFRGNGRLHGLVHERELLSAYRVRRIVAIDHSPGNLE